MIEWRGVMTTEIRRLMPWIGGCETPLDKPIYYGRK